jgi:predicted dehydrogenase
MTSGPTVGIIGLGYGRAHISAFQAHGCRVTALCQRDTTTARKTADAYGVPHVFERWADLLATARPDIVVIATPPHLHLAITRAALDGGAHVLCEKPLAMTTAEAQAMVEAARRAGRVAMTSFNWRFVAAMQRLHAAVAEGAIGRVFHVAARWLGARWADEKAAATWRMDAAQAGHGAMGDMGVHIVDLVRWNFGEFARVAALSGVAYPARSAPGVDRPADAADFCSVVGELASGAQVTFTASRVAHGASDHSLEVYGSLGAARYRFVREGPRWYEGELQLAASGRGFEPVEARGEGIEATDPMDVLGRATIAPLVERFLGAIRDGRPASPSFEDGLAAQAVVDAVGASSARGEWVQVGRSPGARDPR